MSAPIPPALQPVDPKGLTFTRPVKRIHTHADLPIFHSSPAYARITAFIVHLNSSIAPLDGATGKLNPVEESYTNSPSVVVSPEVEGVTKLVERISELIDSAPPEQGPRRFGNAAFRKWLQIAESHITDSPDVDGYLPNAVIPAKKELLHYLVHSFGSGERLDYGTGHELSFAAFLCGIWVLGGFQPGRDEKALVFRTFNAYFKLVRRLVTTYSLEPAGSHGVWGLDDHVFIPYIFGSAQLTTFRPTTETQASESNMRAEEAGLPKPADVVKLDIVNRERERNLYFDAIGFVYDVKKGPFWEHSPILFDISGVQKGWGKINEGMLKMYDKEVLGKLPVVQHFPFGSIFRWSATQSPEELQELDNQKNSEESESSSPPIENTRAPWSSANNASATTRAPWASPDSAVAHMETTRAPWASGSTPSITTTKSGSQPITTRAPWTAPQPPPFPTSAGAGSDNPPPIGQLDGADTKAPWANETISPVMAPPSTMASAHPPVHFDGPDVIAPWISPPYGSPTRSSPMDSRLPWEAAKEQSEEDKEAAGVNVRTAALLGSRRTSSPDSAMAFAAGQGGGRSIEQRRGSLGTGGVRVAETGDLSGRRASRTG